MNLDMQATATPDLTKDTESPPTGPDPQWHIFVGLLPALACVPLLLFSLAALWSREYMQFFPVTIAAVVAFTAFLTRGAEPTTNRERRLAAVAVLCVAAVVLAIGVWKFMPSLGTLSVCLVLLAWSVGQIGNQHWGKVASLACLAATTILWPWNWDLGVTHWLENLAAWGTTKSLDALAIPCINNSGRIEIEGLAVMANEICGGQASLFAYLSFAVLVCMLAKRGLLVSIASLICVPIWVMLSHYIRLFGILLAKEYWERDIATGWDFRILEVSTIIMVLGLIWLSTIFFKQLFEPIPVADAEFGPIFSGINKMFCWPQADPFEEMEPEDEYERKQFLKIKEKQAAELAKIPRYHWHADSRVLWVVRGASVVMLLCGLVPIGQLLSRGLEFGVPSVSPQEAENLIAQDALPAELAEGRWKLRDMTPVSRNPRSSFGRYSLLWRYNSGQKQLIVSVDMPFLGWHDAVAARRLEGWKSESHAVDIENDWPFGFAELENELGGKAYLYYGFVNRKAEPFTKVPAYLSVVNQDGLSGNANQNGNQATYQIQVFIETGEEVSRAERAEIKERFLELREVIKSSVRL